MINKRKGGFQPPFEIIGIKGYNMQRIQKNQKFTVDIIDTNNLGFGVCKIDNFAVFVKNGVEGDQDDLDEQ